MLGRMHKTRILFYLQKWSHRCGNQKPTEFYVIGPQARSEVRSVSATPAAQCIIETYEQPGVLDVIEHGVPVEKVTTKG